MQITTFHLPLKFNLHFCSFPTISRQPNKTQINKIQKKQEKPGKKRERKNLKSVREPLSLTKIMDNALKLSNPDLVSTSDPTVKLRLQTWGAS
jgi:hypothetical protein